MKLIVDAPINSLSFGNVTVNILRELYKKNIEVGLFACNFDLKPFDKIEDSFAQWLSESTNKSWAFLAEGYKTLKLWHITGSEKRFPPQTLFTFYECSAPTPIEIATCKSQEKTIFSSTYARDLFTQAGVGNCYAIPLGFDTSFALTKKQYLDNKIIHFGLMGKFEHRKHTAKIIKAWLKAFGNNNNYQLTCCVTNPFFKGDHMSNLLAQTLEGKRYTNVNFLPYLSTNSEVNELLNAIDVDLTGLSGGEGWNLPSFNATCLGKWSIVLNATSHKDWATSENSILIEPNGKMSVYDGIFFKQGSEYNQGEFYTWDEDVAIDAMKAAAAKAKSINNAGVLLGQTMTYENTVNKILEII